MRNDMQHDTGMNAAGRPSAGSARIARLGELDDYKVADGESDIRGWDVKTATGQHVGKVKELIVDTGVMKARYLDVKLDRKAIGLSEDRHVLVPVGTTRLDDHHDNVIIRESAMDLRDAPPYDPNAFTPEHERTVQGWHGRRESGGAGVPDAMFDDSALRRKRDGAAGVAYLTRSEEELAVGKREVRAGEVEVHKHIETEQVKERVPVMREEVTVERRPVRAGDAGGDTDGQDIGSRDIRIPVMAEQVVVDKRAVPKEEVIIRKRAVQDTKTVEADVRKERVDVKPTGDVHAREGR